MTSLGRGYYEFFFANENDKRTVWAAGTVNLKPGVLRIFEWTKDFNMHHQRNTHAQVWIRLMEFPQEYWMERTLREIANAVGTPLLIDNATTNRLFGHYARILVDMDFTRKIFYEIRVERDGFAFPVEVVYERMPEFCTHCQNIGHVVHACRWLYPRKEKDSSTDKAEVVQGKKQVPTKRIEWVPLKDNPAGIGSSVAFQATSATPHQGPTTIVESQTLPSQQQQPCEVHQHPRDSVQATGVQQHVPTIATLAHDLNSTAVFLALEANLHADEAEARVVNTTSIPPDTDPSATLVSAPHHSFILQNVSEEIPRNFPPVTVTPLETNNVLISSNVNVDPTLQREVNYMNDWLARAAESEVPFVPVVSKKKKGSKSLKGSSSTAYQTRSLGFLPKSQ